MNVLLPLAIVLPIGSAGLSLALTRWRPLQRALSIAVLTASFASAVALLIRVEADGVMAVQVGGWPAPVGITLVADLLSTIMLVVSTFIALVVLLYAIGHGETTDGGDVFHPVYLVLTAGVAASFLTGDLFNLFVAFEIMLISSYVLITLGGRLERVRPGMTYVVISLVASTLFVTAVALIYAATGTVNMADLAGRLDGVDPGLRTALGLLLLVVFGIKAGIFPLFFWLPDSYPTAPAPVTAIFAGLLTKVGMYAIIRTQTLLFPQEDGVSMVLLVAAGLTMVVGVLGAIAQDDVKRILSFHIVSQIGYMLLGLGLFTVAGIAGAIFYVVHHIIVKTALFLVSGLLEDMTGTAALRRLGGLLRRSRLTALLFAVPALSLAGLPPFSGFVAKLGLVEAGMDNGDHAIVAVSLVVSLLTLFSMTKIWAGVFWGQPEEEPPLASARGTAPLRTPRLMAAATATIVVVSVAVAVGAQPVYDLTERAALGLDDPSPYVRTVLAP